MNRFFYFIRRFYPYSIFPGNRCFYSYTFGCKVHRNVVCQRSNFAHFYAFRYCNLISCNGRSVFIIYNLCIYSEFFQNRFQMRYIFHDTFFYLFFLTRIHCFRLKYFFNGLFQKFFIFIIIFSFLIFRYNFRFFFYFRFNFFLKIFF